MSDTTTDPHPWIDRAKMLEAWSKVERLERGAHDAAVYAENLAPLAKSARVLADHARIRADRAWGALVVVLRCWATNTPPPVEALETLEHPDPPGTQATLPLVDPRD